MPVRQSIAILIFVGIIDTVKVGVYMQWAGARPILVSIAQAVTVFVKIPVRSRCGAIAKANFPEIHNVVPVFIQQCDAGAVNDAGAIQQRSGMGPLCEPITVNGKVFDARQALRAAVVGPEVGDEPASGRANGTWQVQHPTSAYAPVEGRKRYNTAQESCLDGRITAAGPTGVDHGGSTRNMRAGHRGTTFRSVLIAGFCAVDVDTRGTKINRGYPIV